jgi:predicted permease
VGFAVRSLRWHWRFHLLIALTLGMGLGVSAIMFGLLDAFLFRGMAHVRAPERLVAVTLPGRTFDDYLTARDRLHTVDLAAYRRYQTSLGAGEGARAITVECVSANYFDVLGTHARHGRPFSALVPSEASAPLAVLSEAVWTSHFGGAGDIVGRSVVLGPREFTVIGVAPARFSGVRVDRPDVWLLLEAAPDLCTPHGSLSGGGASIYVVGRLRNDVAVEQASAEVRTMFPRADSADQGERTAVLRSLHQARLPLIRGDVHVARWAAGAAVCLLCIACLNVCGLLILRGIDRRREIAVRRQLGATPRRIFVQLVAEQLPIAAIGCAAGLVVAWWTGVILGALLPFEPTALVAHPRTVGLLVGLAVLAVLASAVVPAIRGARSDVHHLLRGAEPTFTRRSIAQTALLTVQTALAFALIAGAGLMIRSVTNLWRDPGYDLDKLVLVTVDLPAQGYRPDGEIHQLFHTFVDSVRRVPGVEEAALSSAAPLGALPDSVYVAVRSARAGLPGPPMPAPKLEAVSPEYFSTVGTRIVRGRRFEPRDTLAGRPVAIVNEVTARAIWPDDDPIGQCAFLSTRTECVEIVGVSQARRHASLTAAAPEVFIPLAQGVRYRFQYVAPRSVVVRVLGSPDALTASLAEAVRSVAPNLPAIAVQPFGDLAAGQARGWRMAARTFGLFGAGGVLMAAIGLYAALAFSVRQRTREIGLRMALGARREDVVATVCLRMCWILSGGVLIGAGIVASMARSARWLLFGVAPLDPVALVVAAAVLVAASAAGAWIPAVRAATIDPAVALRQF